LSVDGDGNSPENSTTGGEEDDRTLLWRRYADHYVEGWGVMIAGSVGLAVNVFALTVLFKKNVRRTLSPGEDIPIQWIILESNLHSSLKVSPFFSSDPKCNLCRLDKPTRSLRWYKETSAFARISPLRPLTCEKMVPFCRVDAM